MGTWGDPGANAKRKERYRMKKQVMEKETEERIGIWWEAVEGLYCSNELTESQYLTLKELLKSVIFNAREKYNETN